VALLIPEVSVILEVTVMEVGAQSMENPWLEVVI
jgi:hypothetical protein